MGKNDRPHSVPLCQDSVSFQLMKVTLGEGNALFQRAFGGAEGSGNRMTGETGEGCPVLSHPRHVVFGQSFRRDFKSDFMALWLFRLWQVPLNPDDLTSCVWPGDDSGLAESTDAQVSPAAEHVRQTRQASNEPLKFLKLNFTPKDLGSLRLQMQELIPLYSPCIWLLLISLGS